MTEWLLLLLAFAQTADPEAVARKAVDDFHAGRFTEAREGFREAVKYSPRNAGLWAFLGLTEGSLNDLPSAIKDLEKARSLTPTDPQILFNLGLFYGKAGLRENAREAYSKGLEAQPEDLGANQNYALLLIQDGLFEQAIAPLKRLQTLQPGNPSAHVSLIECQFKAGFKEAAADEIRSFLETSNATLDVYLKTAAVLAADGAPGAAEMVLNSAKRSYGQAAEVHAGIGKLLLDRGEFEGAVGELGKAVQLKPEAPGYALGLAEALLLWKHFTPAVQFLEAVRPEFGTLPDFHYKLGLALYGLYRYPQALAEFEGVVREHPQTDSAWYFLGNTWLAMGKLDNAEQAYRKAISLNQKVAGYYAALGELLRRSEANREVEAAATLRQALTLDPSDLQSMKELALCDERQGHFDAAAGLLRQVVRDRPGFKEAHVALARIYYKLHKRDDGDREKQVVVQLETAERATRAASRTAPAAK